MRSVWSELLPYNELTSTRVLDMLASRDLGVYVAVMPETLSGAGHVVRACKARGIRVGLWPMLADADGRWPSVHNVERFAAFVAEVRAAVAPLPDELVVDFEPPVDVVRALLRLDGPTIVRQLRRKMPPIARAHFAELVRSAEAAAMATISAAFPLVLADDEAHDGWQRFLGTPVDSTPTTRVSAMLYTSIIEGSARGLLSRGDVVSLLGAAARAASRRYGRRASVSLGAVGTGALGDEPTYRNVAELEHDVAIVSGAGIDHIILFSLCGALARGSPERWLDALVDPRTIEAPRWTVRMAATALAAVTASRLMGYEVLP